MAVCLVVPAELEWVTRAQATVDLLVYAYGTIPEDEHAELLESAV